MRIEATAEAVELVQAAGGKLYVHAERHRCCGGATVLLETASGPGERTFTRFEADGIEVYLHDRITPPELLELDTSGRKTKSVRAYWNGCAFVV